MGYRVKRIEALEKEIERLKAENNSLAAEKSFWNKEAILHASDQGERKIEKALLENKEWIPVSKRLPKNEERVLICANRKWSEREVIQIRTIAMYEDGTMHTDNSGFSWEDHDFEYDEETDDYIISEGWWEQNMYCEEFGAVDDFVTHWKPLPEPYREVI